MEVKAAAKSVRISTRKVSIVASLVRGRTVADALTILEHTPRRAAQQIAKVISSAKANAENNHDIDVKTLVIKKLDIGPATPLKRYRPAAHGRAQPYKKRSTHIRVIVEGDVKAKKAKDKAAATTKKADKTDAKTAEKPIKDETIKNKRSFKRESKQSSATITKQRTGRRGNK